ncbi:hypothetical protein HOG98_06740 [bacterium]|jgi:hypothetical protein|nr:hypothetical protein [bacterium]MBT6121615.1 hypothetical protein [bacterium]
MELLKDLFLFVKARKVYWIVPLLLVLLTIGFLLFVSTGTAVSPFIYMLF